MLKRKKYMMSMEQKTILDRGIHNNSEKMNLILMISSTCFLEGDYSTILTLEDNNITIKLKEDHNIIKQISKVKMLIQVKHYYSKWDH